MGQLGPARSRWDLAGIEPGRDDGDGNVRSPACRTLDSDLAHVVRAQQLDRRDVTRAGVVVAGMRELHTVDVDHTDGEAGPVRVDPRNW